METDERQSHIAAAIAPLKALLYTWGATVALAVLGYALTASALSLGDLTWHQSVRFGGSLWMLAMGSRLELADATISLMPLTLTCIILVLLYRFVTGARIERWSQVAAATASALATTTILSFLALPQTSRPAGIVAASLATALIAAWAKAREDMSGHRGVIAARQAGQLLGPVLVALACLAVLALAAAVVLGRSRIGAIYASYVAGASGATMLTLAQLLFLPNILVWIVAFAAGPGFAVGEGTRFSALGVVTEPLPAIPFFGALPGPGVTLPWLVAVFALASFGYGLLRSRRYEDARRAGTVAAAAVAIALVGATAAMWLVSGSIGPGRMSVVGPPMVAGLVLAAHIGLAPALGLLARHAFARVRAKPGEEARQAEGTEKTEEWVEEGDNVAVEGRIDE
ncbi:MAG: DUF6350 family protein [Actinomycetaceae bacterium]|nr:DUF6350 family protein [Actinomycetaceae bacterium]